MRAEDNQAVGNAYQAKFGNLDELATAEVMWDPRFIALLQSAIHRDTPVTREELVGAFPETANAY